MMRALLVALEFGGSLGSGGHWRSCRSYCARPDHLSGAPPFYFLLLFEGPGCGRNVGANPTLSHRLVGIIIIFNARYRHSELRSPGSHRLLGPRRHPQKASRQLLRESELLSSHSPYLHCAVSRTLNLNLATFIPDVSDISVIRLTLIRGFDNPTGLVWGDKGRNEGAKDRGEYRQAAGADRSGGCGVGCLMFLAPFLQFSFALLLRVSFALRDLVGLRPQLNLRSKFRD
jgi:hypothetical protein